MYNLWKKSVEARKNDLNELTNTCTFNTFYIAEQSYDTHNNGGKPFTVKVGNYGIRVFLEGGDMVYHIPNSCGYWDGFDPSVYKMHGNSILVKLSDTEYIFIGHKVIAFHIDDVITDFLSPVGNSDVPYHVCYGTKYVYFMLDMKKISNEDILHDKLPKNANDIYMEFYNIK